MLRQQFRGFTMIFHHIPIINTSLSSSVDRSVSRWTDPLMQSTKTSVLLCIDHITRVRLHDHSLQVIQSCFPFTKLPTEGSCVCVCSIFPLLTLAQQYLCPLCALAYHSDSDGRFAKHHVRPPQAL